MTHNLIRIISRRLHRANDRVMALATLDVQGRVAHRLLALARQYGRRAGRADRQRGRR